MDGQPGSAEKLPATMDGVRALRERLGVSREARVAVVECTGLLRDLVQIVAEYATLLLMVAQETPSLSYASTYEFNAGSAPSGWQIISMWKPSSVPSYMPDRCGRGWNVCSTAYGLFYCNYPSINRWERDQGDWVTWKSVQLIDYFAVQPPFVPVDSMLGINWQLGPCATLVPLDGSEESSVTSPPLTTDCKSRCCFRDALRWRGSASLSQQRGRHARFMLFGKRQCQFFKHDYPSREPSLLHMASCHSLRPPGLHAPGEGDGWVLESVPVHPAEGLVDVVACLRVGSVVIVVAETVFHKHANFHVGVCYDPESRQWFDQRALLPKTTAFAVVGDAVVIAGQSGPSIWLNAANWPRQTEPTFQPKLLPLPSLERNVDTAIILTV